MGVHRGLSLSDEGEAPFTCGPIANVCSLEQRTLAGLPIAESMIFFDEEDHPENMQIKFDRSADTEAVLIRAFREKYGAPFKEQVVKPTPPFNDDTFMTIWELPREQGLDVSPYVGVFRGSQTITVAVFFARPSAAQLSPLNRSPEQDF